MADAQVGAGDLVLDVGAGTGVITAALVDRGARVVAVELHLERAAILRRRFVRSPVTVVVTDCADLRLPRRPFRVVANPPFSVTVSLLRRLTAPGSRLIRADVAVPWHVARRWSSGDVPGAGRWRSTFDAYEGRRLPRTAFTPAAPNGVVVLTIVRRTSDVSGGCANGSRRDSDRRRRR